MKTQEPNLMSSAARNARPAPKSPCGQPENPLAPGSSQPRPKVISALVAALCLMVGSVEAQPTVAITSPADGTNVVTSVTNVIVLSVTASSSFEVTNLTLLVNDIGVRSFALAPGQNNVSAQLPLLLPSETSDTFTVSATDASGATTVSLPVTVNVTFSAPPAAPMNGMVLWLAADVGVSTDVDGQSITNWADQSGLGNDARQTSTNNSPFLRNAIQINGAAVARFNVLDTGVPRFMLVSNNASLSKFTTNFTFLTVAQENDSGATYAILSKTTGSYLPNPFRWHWNAGGAIGLDLGAGGNPTIVNNSGVTTPAGNYSILGARVGNNTVGQTMNFTNGAVSTIGTAAISDANVPLNIGQGASQFTGMYGNIAEILCYSNRLSDNEFLVAQAYLNAKYFLGRVVAVLGNVAPAVTLTSPLNGASFDTLTNGSILFSATTASTNPLFSVSYFANGLLVGSSNVVGQIPPFQFTMQAQLPGSVSLTVVAMDILGVRGTSAPVVVTVTGPPLVPPSSGLAVWLKPDAGVTTHGNGTIAQWNDQSGRTNNAAQLTVANAPAFVANAINGFSAAYFNQLTNINPQYLDIASAPSIQRSNNFSVIAVARPLNQSGNYDILSKTDSGSSSPFPFEWRFNTGGATEMDLGAGSGTTVSNVSSFTTTTASFNILSAVVGNGAIKQYLGYNPGTISTIGSAAIADGGTPMRIGNRGLLDATMHGYIAEILYYDSPLTDANRLLAVGYLANKYGLNYSAFTNTPPTVAITSPTNGTTSPAGANLTLSISASAAAAGAYITTLDFLANGTLFASSSVSNQTINAPFQVNLASPGNYVFTVRATDNFGFQATSSSLTVTGLSFATPPVPPTNSLVLWLNAGAGVMIDADGESITNWVDQSGLGNHAQQTTSANAPTLRTNVINGLPVARFNVLDTGMSRYMTVAPAPSISNFTTNFTFLTVAREFDQGAAYAIISETTGTFFPNPFRWHFNGGGTIGLDLGAGGAPTVVNNSSTSAQGLFAVLGARAGNNTLSQTVNLIQGAGATIGAAAIADAGLGLNIGLGASQFTGMYGNVAELMCYSTRLSDAQFVQAQAYLANKYALSLAPFALPGSGVPTLTAVKIGNTLQLSWPLNFTGYVLEGRTSLGSGAWSPIATNPPNNQVTVNLTGTGQFYRLRQ